jgi:uncharacterized membrane protein (DUF4010 family)
LETREKPGTRAAGIRTFAMTSLGATGAAAGVAIASGISFIRVFVIVAALQPALLWLIAPALVMATLVAGVAGFLRLRGQARRIKPATPTTFRNPFAFWSVIAFAIFVGFAVFAARIVGERLGAMGVILSAAVAGFVDVDAITVSITKLTSISAQSATLAVGRGYQYGEQTGRWRAPRKRSFCTVPGGFCFGLPRGRRHRILDHGLP